MTTTITPRVASSPSGGRTARLHSLLLLEGDEAGYLLLEGDAQSGGDRMELEGDESAFAVGGTIIRRVAEAVA